MTRFSFIVIVVLASACSSIEYAPHIEKEKLSHMIQLSEQDQTKLVSNELGQLESKKAILQFSERGDSGWGIKSSFIHLQAMSEDGWIFQPLVMVMSYDTQNKEFAKQGFRFNVSRYKRKGSNGDESIWVFKLPDGKEGRPDFFADAQKGLRPYLIFAGYFIGPNKMMRPAVLGYTRYSMARMQILYPKSSSVYFERAVTPGGWTALVGVSGL